MLSLLAVTENKKQESPRPKFDSCLNHTTAVFQQAVALTMITIETEICNPISQTFYDNTVLSLDLNLITCTCGHTGCLVWYGSYTRKLRLDDQVITLRIARVFCNSCHHTHALLLSSIVPYSQIPLEVHASIAESYENGSGYKEILDSQSCIDENTISSIVRSFRLYWRERLRSLSVPLYPLSSLVRSCFAFFARPFMQIKRTRNKLFSPPT